tara:strand:+ start:739 stop:930 length:192 start_codon:yes stop_codon:yes gene_type:complete
MSKLLTSKDLAEKLNVNPQLINESRVSGQLLGADAPKFLKMGRSVRYEESTIEAWLNNFRDVK